MLAPHRSANRNSRIHLVLLASLLGASFCFSASRQEPPPTLAPTISELKSRADSGDPAARHQLVKFLISADPSSPGYDMALNWIRSVASKNNPDAQFLLGFLYQHGKGLPLDLTKAAENYRAAALQGNALAENNLGALYHHGTGVPRNMVLAFQWYRAAAVHGNPAGQHNLATLYYLGSGTPIDFSQAAKWFRAAADQGFVPSESDLAFCYVKAIGVSRDYSQAAHWALLAADKGHPRAEALLGYLYEHGQGLPVDYAAAYVWYSRSAAAGEKSSVDRLRSLTQIMTRNQLDKANAMISSLSTPPESNSASIPSAVALFPNP